MTTHLALVAFCAMIAGSQAPWVSCWDSAGQFVGSRSVHTHVLPSPDGRFRAYAEVSAGARGESDCENTVRLFVSTDNSPYDLVFTQKPSEITGTANSLGPIAWSPNSRWLAVEFGYWFYMSDNASQGLLLYDSHTRRISTPNVIGLIENAIRKGCSLYLRSVVGFDSQGRVVLTMADLPDEEGHVTTCIEGRAEWLYDPITGKTFPREGRR